MSEATYDVVWPKSALGVQSIPLAPRCADLHGARVGFLWDYLFRGDELFPLASEQLRQQFPDIEIVNYDIFGNTHGGDEREMIAGLPDVLRDHRIDAVISGIGC